MNNFWNVWHSVHLELTSHPKVRKGKDFRTGFVDSIIFLQQEIHVTNPANVSQKPTQISNLEQHQQHKLRRMESEMIYIAPTTEKGDSARCVLKCGIVCYNNVMNFEGKKLSYFI